MNVKRVLEHTLFWLVIVAWTSTIYDFGKGEFILTFMLFNFIRLPVIVAATYVVLYVLIPRYLILQRVYEKFAVLFILILLITILLDRLVIGMPIIAELLKETELVYHFFNQVPIIRNAFLLVAIIGLASMIRFFKLYLIQERRQHQLQEMQLTTELAFLKAQVNPHFLFNALNNLYSMAVQKESWEVAKGLESLSGIMRYLTYDSNAPKVSLEKEIDLLQKYIENQQLRLREEDDVTIVFKIKGDVQQHEIAPVLLLPIVENAFKHGVIPEQSAVVIIQLEVKERQLWFRVENTVQDKLTPDFEQNGIGLPNIRKRLNLLYPEQHQFYVGVEQAFFVSDLKINYA